MSNQRIMDAPEISKYAPLDITGSIEVYIMVIMSKKRLGKIGGIVKLFLGNSEKNERICQGIIKGLL